MIVILGKSASGKDTVLKELEKYGYNRIVTYTTRPPKTGEIGGKDYKFVSKNEFFRYLKNKEFLEVRSCQGTFGECHYGLKKRDLIKAQDNNIITLTPNGLKELKKNGIPHISIFIDTGIKERSKRLLNRGDEPDEIVRKIIQDENDFNGAATDYVVNGNQNVQKLVAEIMNILKKDMDKKADRKKINTFYISLDNTTFDTIERIVREYNTQFQYYDGFLHVKPSQIRTRDFLELKCTDKQYIDTFSQLPRFFNGLYMMPGIKELINTLHDLSYNIIFVSMGGSSNLILKGAWIKNFFPFADFIPVDSAVYKDKSHIDMSDGVLIDDDETILRTSNAALKICFGGDDWNKKWTGIRCYNGFDIFMRLIENNVIKG